MNRNELIKYIELTWENLKDEGTTTMLRVDESKAPIFLRATDQTVAFLITLDINRDPDIKQKKYNNVSIQIEKLSPETKAIVVTLTNQRFLDTFAKIAADVIATTMSVANESEQISIFCIKVNSWKNIFSRGIGEILTPEEQVGLYGELEFLKSLINEGVPTNSVIDAWKGADAEDKDFQFGGIGVEVKSSIKQDKLVKISNIRQLDTTGYSELYLYYYSFAKSNGGACTLPSQIDEVRSLLVGSPYLEEFEAKLLSAGYNDSDKDSYPASYTSSLEDAYHVYDKFPRLVKPGIPDAILDANYIVDLNVCDNYLISYNCLIETIKGA